MKNFAILKETNPFFLIFAGGKVPIKLLFGASSRGVVKVALEGCDETEAYMLDWLACTAEQRRRIAVIATQLRGSTPDAFKIYMDRGGDLPIRVSQTAGATIGGSDLRSFL